MAKSTSRSSYLASGESLRTAPSGNPASIIATLPTPNADQAPDGYADHRRLLVALAALRAGLAMVAIPLAPALYRDHVHVLVLLRPSKEVLLYSGYRLEQHDITPLVAMAAALPLLLGGVWVMFALGRAYADSITEPRGGLVGRLLPPDRLERLVGAVEDQGTRLVFLGRLAAFPSTLVAAAAGASGMATRRFLIADTLGALTSVVLLVGAGMLLEDAYEAAGPWLTAGGVAVLAAAVVVLGRSLNRAGSPPGGRGGAS
jgi:membrane protein DedA with SNARE-associated domain